MRSFMRRNKMCRPLRRRLFCTRYMLRVAPNPRRRSRQCHGWRSVTPTWSSCSRCSRQHRPSHWPCALRVDALDEQSRGSFDQIAAAHLWRVKELLTNSVSAQQVASHPHPGSEPALPVFALWVRRTADRTPGAPYILSKLDERRNSFLCNRGLHCNSLLSCNR